MFPVRECRFEAPSFVLLFVNCSCGLLFRAPLPPHQDTTRMVEQLLHVGALVPACVAGLTCWYPDVHEQCWRALLSSREGSDWVADAPLIDMVLARVAIDTLAASPVFSDIVSHSLVSARLSNVPFTTSPQYLVCALTASRLYPAATKVLMRLKCVASGLRSSGQGAMTLLRLYLRALVRQGARPEDGLEWHMGPELAHCALAVLESDYVESQPVDITPVLLAPR